MAKFHINPKTGEPGQCRAEKQCPFGGDEAHFTSKEAARQAYEAAQPTFTPEPEEDPYAHLSDQELEKLEHASMGTHRSAREPLTDEEYDRHYEYVRRVRKSNPSTHKSLTVRSKYPAERAALHKEIVDELLKEYEHIPSDGKVLFVGGITGAGKSTVIREEKELGGENYAPVNPDIIKEKMIEKDMHPKIPGLLPMETDELIRYEATVVSEQLSKALSAQKKNIVFDKTMSSGNQVTKTVDELKKLGYSEFSGVFVDVDSNEAYARIRARHHEGLNRYLTKGEGTGERPVPGSAVASTRTEIGSPFRSKNGEIFAKLAADGVFTTKARVFDSSNAGVEIPIEEFGK